MDNMDSILTKLLISTNRKNEKRKKEKSENYGVNSTVLSSDKNKVKTSAVTVN